MKSSDFWIFNYHRQNLSFQQMQSCLRLCPLWTHVDQDETVSLKTFVFKIQIQTENKWCDVMTNESRILMNTNNWKRYEPIRSTTAVTRVKPEFIYEAVVWMYSSFSMLFFLCIWLNKKLFHFHSRMIEGTRINLNIIRIHTHT